MVEILFIRHKLMAVKYKYVETQAGAISYKSWTFSFTGGYDCPPEKTYIDDPLTISNIDEDDHIDEIIFYSY